jgi:hypothetical protein
MDARKPHLRGIRKLFHEPVMAVIAAKTADKARLPHGLLGETLQQFDAPMLARIALEAVVPLLGKQWKRDNPQTIQLAIKQDIGELFYGNARLHAAAREARKRSATKDAKRLQKWRRRMMDGKVGLERDQTLKERSAKLRKARQSIWWHAIKDVPREDVIKAGAWLYDSVLESGVAYFTGRQLLANPNYGDEIHRLQRIVVRGECRAIASRLSAGRMDQSDDGSRGHQAPICIPSQSSNIEARRGVVSQQAIQGSASACGPYVGPRAATH